MNKKSTLFFDLLIFLFFGFVFVCVALYLFVPAFLDLVVSVLMALRQLVELLRIIVPLLILSGMVWLFGKIYGSLIQARNAARQIEPTESGLYPLVDVNGQITNFNDPRVQMLFAWSQAQAMQSLKPTAVASQKVTEALQSGNWEIWEPEQPKIEAPKEIKSLTVYEADSQKIEPTIGIGVEENGSLLEVPLEDRGNFLVAGLPGYGKSTLIASMVVWVARQDPTGKQVQIAILDPKQVDYAAIPNNAAIMAMPRAVQEKECLGALTRIHDEVHRRNKLLASTGTKSLAHYNSQNQEKIPYMVGFIDEMSMFVGNKEFTQMLRVITSMGRASGISLVLATQRPSASVFDQTVKAMAGMAISFRVGSQVDSRIILDRSGAESLPDIRGRCLVYDGSLREVQALDAQTKTRFDSYVKGLPTKDLPYEVVDASYTELQPDPEHWDSTFWDEFCRNYISRYPQANTTQLAKAMAARRADGRDFETFRSTAWGYLKKYSNRYG